MKLVNLDIFLPIVHHLVSMYTSRSILLLSVVLDCRRATQPRWTNEKKRKLPKRQTEKNVRIKNVSLYTVSQKKTSPILYLL